MCVYGIVYHEHHWKQSGLYSSMQKPKPTINHQPVHQCIAVSDLLCATIEMPLTFTTLIIGRWDFSDTLSQIQGSVAIFANYVTPATLRFTAFNRYMKIVKTNHYNKIFSPSRSKIWLSCLWLSFAFRLLIVRVTNWIRTEFNQSFTLCSFAYPTSESRIIHYCITIGLLFFCRCVSVFSVITRFFSKSMSIRRTQFQRFRTRQTVEWTTAQWVI